MTETDLRKATAILYRLLENGEFVDKSDRELFASFDEPEVMAALSAMEAEMDCYIFKSSDRHTLYLVPTMDNTVLGFSNEELRNAVAGRSTAKQEHLYLGYFITLCLLVLFYRGQGYTVKPKENLPFDELIKFVSERLGKLAEDRAKAVELENEHGFNILAVHDEWNGVNPIMDGLETKRQKTQAGMALRLLRFLQDQGLIQLLDEGKNIRTTTKCDDIVRHYYMNPTFRAEILSLLSGGYDDAENQ